MNIIIDMMLFWQGNILWIIKNRSNPRSYSAANVAGQRIADDDALFFFEGNCGEYRIKEANIRLFKADPFRDKDAV